MELNVIKNLPNFSKNFKTEIRNSYQFSLFEVAMLIVVLVLFYWFIISPKKSNIKKIDQTLSALTEELNSIENKVSSLKALGMNLASKEAELVMLDEALPLDSRLTKLEILLEDLAASSGVTVGNIAFSEDKSKVYAENRNELQNIFKTKRSLNKVDGNILVLGTFQQLKAFLQKIESSGRILNTVNMDITATQDDKFDMNLSVEAYYFGS